MFSILIRIGIKFLSEEDRDKYILQFKQAYFTSDNIFDLDKYILQFELIYFVSDTICEKGSPWSSPSNCDCNRIDQDLSKSAPPTDPTNPPAAVQMSPDSTLNNICPGSVFLSCILI